MLHNSSIELGIGPASDYDLWADVVKDPSWSYEGMLPYFRMSETHHGKSRNDKQHGYEGPLHTTPIPMNHPERMYPLRESVRLAWEQAGVDYIGDGNTGHPLGLTDLEEAWIEGKRQFPGKFFDLSLVKVLLETLVRSVTIEERAGKLAATGIDLMDGRHISATREVIVSSGVFHTPKILMLSGIGDRTVLEQHSIPTLVHNTEVGKGLFVSSGMTLCRSPASDHLPQDHLSVGLTWKLKHPEKGLALGSPLLTDPSFFNGWPLDFIQFGQVSTDGLETILQGSRTESADRKILLRPEACHTETVCLYAPMGVRMSGVDVAHTGEYITTITVCLTPTSRGSVTLASSDPADPPIIDVNFNATEADRFILREGLKKTVSVMRATKSGQSFVDEEVVPEGHEAVLPDSAEEVFDKRIRDFGFSLDHPCGSCAMGKVVDSECKVVGVQGLRVVDASIFPVPISAHPQVCVYALVEKAAEMIAKSMVDVRS